MNDPANLKVAIVTTAKGGGAGTAAVRLTSALKSTQVTAATLLAFEEISMCEHSVFLSKSWELESIPSILSEYRTELSNTYFTWNPVGANLNNLLKDNSFEVVNLHWTDGIVGLVTLLHLSQASIPVVWTLHDTAVLTGGCHYPAGCEKFQETCLRCPQIRSELSQKLAFDPVEEYFALKKTIFSKLRNVTFVTPSRWLAQEAKKSAILRDFKIRSIPNPLDMNLFKPRNKAKVRTKFGLPADGFVMVIGADHLSEKRKNVQGVTQIFKNVSASINPDKPWSVLVFGNNSDTLADLPGIRVKRLGHIESELEMSEIYSCADVLMHLASEDNLPNVVAEAMACGLPTFGFDVGGMPEMIDSSNGFLAEFGAYEILVAELLRISENADHLARLSKNARKKALQMFDPGIVAEKYQRIYHEAIEEIEETTHLDVTDLAMPATSFSQKLLHFTFTSKLASQAAAINELKETNSQLRTTQHNLTESNTELLGMIEALQSLSRASQAAAINELKELKDELKDELKELKELNDELKDELNELKDELNELKDELNELKNELKNELNELKDELKELKEINDELND